jgi:hypothetical protein
MIKIIDTSKSQEVEPNPELINYFQESQKFSSALPENFLEGNEFYNITSNIEQNIFLINRLEERGLLKDSNRMIDCGIGLGFTLFDFYLQSLDSKKVFSFSGIEKQSVYIDFIKENLIDFWKDGIDLIEDDIMNHSYKGYDIVYSYSPYRTTVKLKEFYEKVVSEIESGSLIIENANSGLGHGDVLLTIENLERIEIDDIAIFRKI